MSESVPPATEHEGSATPGDPSRAWRNRVLLVGLVFGYVLGARSARAEIARKKARLRE